MPGGGTAGPGGPGGGAGLFFAGQPGITRLFGASFAGEASWLLPAALIGLVAGLWFTRHTARTAPVRAALLLWGGWALVTGAVFSFMDGIIHPYYTVALAPAIAALVGICVVELWRGRRYPAPRAVLAAMSAATGVWAFILLDRTPDWQPWLRWAVLVGSIVVAAVIAAGVHRLGRLTAGVAASAIILGGAASLGYTIETAAHAPSGPGAMAGPAAAHVEFGGFGAPPGDGPPGGPGRPGKSVAENTELQDLIRAADNRWAAASVGSMTAGALELETGASVMAIGGFAGSDNSPTLEQFQAYVADGQVRYFIAGGHFGPRRDSGSAT
jgi:4-amino-4-deoxy-L-arabinose transferase-like glycosyltransferase